MIFGLHGVRRWLLIALTLLVAARDVRALDPHRPLREYGRQTWQTENGLPQDTVHSVVQMKDGYLWLATDDGLVRFNGIEFKVFTAETTPALRSDSIEGLSADSLGRLWVRTASGLVLVQQNRFQSFGVAEGLPDATVWFTHQDRHGRVWIATASGLCTVKVTRCDLVPATKGLSVNQEGRFAEAPDGSIWLASGDETVHLDASSLAVIARLRSSSASEILVQQVDHGGRLLVGTGDGLAQEQHGRLQPVAVAGAPARFEIAAMLQAADGSTWLGSSAGVAHGSGDSFVLLPATKGFRIQALFQDREGTVWVGTDHGAGRIIQNRLEPFPVSDVLAGATVLSFLEDREGNLWLGTESDGLAVLHEQKFTTYTVAEGLSGNVVRSVLQDAAGTVWVGTDGAGLNRRTAAGFSTMTAKDGLSSNVILSLASGANGDLWVGTPTGLNRIRGGEVKVYTAADGLADDFIRSLLVDRHGDVWVGTRHGLTRISGETMTNFTAMDGLGSDYIGVMIEARNGDLWIGTAGGLTRLRDGQFTNVKLAGGLARNVVTAIHEEGDGTFWLGSNGGGLSRMRDGVIKPVDAATLPQAITGVLEDQQQRLWIGSRTGVYRVALSALDHFMAQGGDLPVASYDTSDGMRSRECSSGGHPAAVRMRDGTLWFATLRGVSTVDPERLHENAVPPLVTIETVLVNDVPHQGSGELTLEPGRQRVEFQYAGLSFVAPQRVQYRYRLEGFDREWVDAGTHRAAFYTNLQPGRYVFHVQARNNDGVWSASDAALALRVKPFFWQTIWFYLLLLLAAAGVAYFIYARRVRRVKLLYQGVMEERGRIAREIHDTLAQGIVSISLQLEVVSRLLTTSVDAARTQLDETRGLVRQSLADARSSIWDLRSEEAEELPVRVSRALKLLTGPAGIFGRMNVTGSYRAIPRMVEDELLRIAQEAITNAVRHAECSHIEVTLVYEIGRFRLSVQDDGRGFDAAAGSPAGHFGLQGMRERAAKIDADLKVASEAGQGTQITLERSLV